MYDVLVIGGGVIGCAIARELSRRSGRICVVERNEDVCTGTSKANSAIVHAGFDAEPGTRKARFNVEGSRMMEALSHELDFPYRRCGALVLCLDPADREKLQALYQRGLANGVEGLELVEGEALHRMEPALSQQAVAALYAPTSAILCISAGRGTTSWWRPAAARWRVVPWSTPPVCGATCSITSCAAIPSASPPAGANTACWTGRTAVW